MPSLAIKDPDGKVGRDVLRKCQICDADYRANSLTRPPPDARQNGSDYA